MGLAAANLPGFDIPARRPFFETLVQLILGLLFISISATVTPASLRHVVLPALVLVAILALVVRPVVAFLATVGSGLSTSERSFIGWMAPRGIIAAATASTFSTILVQKGIGGADRILPATFVVIVATVTLYGLVAATEGAELEGVTTVLLLTREDDFNALASTVLADRVAPRRHGCSSISISGIDIGDSIEGLDARRGGSGAATVRNVRSHAMTWISKEDPSPPPRHADQRGGGNLLRSRTANVDPDTPTKVDTTAEGCQSRLSSARCRASFEQTRLEGRTIRPARTEGGVKNRRT
jgi:hypothetical protein